MQTKTLTIQLNNEQLPILPVEPEAYLSFTIHADGNELEFELPTPISKERAMEVAVEQYGFCPDLDQNEDGSIGSLADVLWQSTVWYFWWD